jgi:protocatechuate 3,4-dioxygenase beta subunit
MSRGVETTAAAAHDHAYAAWEEIGRNEPALSGVNEPMGLSELTGPGPALATVKADDSDLTTNAGTGAEAVGQRIIVAGRVTDQDDTPVPGVLIEIWQANAAGRYRHDLDSWRGPIDPNFVGRGRCYTDDSGNYRFLTVRPGAYPWKDETNEWRPAHIHLSLMGPTLQSRLVTQMYFPGDPLFDLDTIFQAIPDHLRDRAICQYDHSLTAPGWAMGFRFDIKLWGEAAESAANAVGGDS